MTERDWIKVHLMCGVKTNIVTAVEVSNRYANDARFFQPLVETTAANFVIQASQRGQGICIGGELADGGRPSRNAVHPFQKQQCSALEATLRETAKAGAPLRMGETERALAADVSLLFFQSEMVLAAIPQTQQCRINVQHDQGQVRR